MTVTPRPTTTHPATWLRVGDLVLGDVVVTRADGTTAPVTGLTPAGKGRTRVAVGDRVHYPHATTSTPVLVLR